MDDTQIPLSNSSPVIGGKLKRTIDLVGAVGGLLFLSPLLVLLSAFVKLSDGGPVVYGHRRVGRHGKEFLCLKFRTMVPNGKELLEAHFLTHLDAHQEWLATRKLKNDPRVTPIGAVMRKLSLDELPQLLNILMGHMSIVGPRPVVDEELFHYGSHVTYYLRARPGLTGLWQVSGRNDVSYESRVALDRHYVENWTLATDMFIIVRTIPAVCMARGSY